MSKGYSPDEVKNIAFYVVTEGDLKDKLVSYDRDVMAECGWDAAQKTIEVVGTITDARAINLIEATPHLIEIITLQAQLVTQMRTALDLYKDTLTKLGVSTDFPVAMDQVCGQMETQLFAAIRATEYGVMQVVKEMRAEDLTSKKT